MTDYEKMYFQLHDELDEKTREMNELVEENERLKKYVQNVGKNILKDLKHGLCGIIDEMETELDEMYLHNEDSG